MQAVVALPSQDRICSHQRLRPSPLVGPAVRRSTRREIGVIAKAWTPARPEARREIVGHLATFGTHRRGQGTPARVALGGGTGGDVIEGGLSAPHVRPSGGARPLPGRGVRALLPSYSIHF